MPVDPTRCMSLSGQTAVRRQDRVTAMVSIGPPDIRRIDIGSIDVDYYLARAKRCRARALDAALTRFIARFLGRTPTAPAAPVHKPTLPGLADSAPRPS